MKLMIASDIHGSSYYCRKMLEAYEDSGAEKLIVLGDVLYHGPRNDLPKDYAPKEVIAMLNPYADRILCIRGNCEAEVDQMVLEFPVLADYAVLFVDGITMYASHGHVYNEKKLPPLARGDVLLNGHTHIPAYADHGSYFFVNPGSVSIPKENTAHSYVIYEAGSFGWYDLETGEEYRRERI